MRRRTDAPDIAAGQTAADIYAESVSPFRRIRDYSVLLVEFFASSLECRPRLIIFGAHRSCRFRTLHWASPAEPTGCAGGGDTHGCPLQQVPENGPPCRNLGAMNCMPNDPLPEPVIANGSQAVDLERAGD